MANTSGNTNFIGFEEVSNWSGNRAVRSETVQRPSRCKEIMNNQRKTRSNRAGCLVQCLISLLMKRKNITVEKHMIWIQHIVIHLQISQPGISNSKYSDKNVLWIMETMGPTLTTQEENWYPKDIYCHPSILELWLWSIRLRKGILFK